MNQTNPADGRILLDEARWGLAKVWFPWAFALFALIVVQSIIGRYGSRVQEAWSWFLPTVLPTLSLMVGVLGAGAMQEQDDARKVRGNFFAMARWMSVGYLAVLSLTILLQPFSSTGVIESYMLSNYWLAPLQGIVGGAIGLLFTSQQRVETTIPAVTVGNQPRSSP